MDIKRILLIGAMAVVAYLLLIKWNEFSTTHKAGAPVAATAGTSVDIPDGGSQAPHSNDEIPVAPKPEAVVPTITSVSTSLIHVTTDVLELKIDPLGGDLVYAALRQHLTKLDGSKQPFVLLTREGDKLYVAQSGLYGQNGTDTATGRPVFSSERNEYVLPDDSDELQIPLSYTDANGVVIRKVFTVKRSNYLVDVQYQVNNSSANPWQAGFYAQLKRNNFADPSAESGNGLGVMPFLGVATSTNDQRFLKMDFEEIAEDKFSTERKDGWIAIIQHYFLTAWVAEKGTTYTYSALQTRTGDNLARVQGPVMTIAPGTSATFTSHFYAGPKDQDSLAAIAEGLDLSVDYSWLWWVAQPLFWLLTFFHSISGNWGFAIILLTIVVKGVFFYPSAMAYRSMAKMRKIQPKLMSLKDLYPDDKQKQSQEMMALYRKEGVNPLGGCLPIFLQMPVFIALYWVLLESVELRHAPFVGYIHDLSAMDPYFILPLIMGASMWFQQKLNPPPPDPMQAKVLQFLPIIFTFFFLFFPSGLVLYWVVNNLLSIAQQWVITKRIEAEA